MISKDLQTSLLACSALMQKKMHDLLPIDFVDSKLVEAMRYSALSDGKRIRPFLLINAAEIFNAPFSSALQAASALEFVHVYSLIHDDLPAMDDDNFRRGKPTCHKKFDEATAILAGDALLTYAFEILADSETHSNPSIRCQLITTLAKAAGFRGMTGGQMIDMERNKHSLSVEEMVKLHRLKTGELFMASAEMGAILGNAGIESRNALRYYAHDLGLAFQIKDDILDHHEVNVGKSEIDETTNKKSHGNTSIVDIIGLENAKQRLELLKNQAINHLKIFGPRANILSDLAHFVTVRDK
jgi:farnesyl diphosphate synthase